MRNLRIFLAALMAVCVIIIGAISYNSIKNIHYLRSSCPGPLTAEDALYGALVEFLKVHIISLPLMVVILLAAFFLWLYRNAG
jgi:hypothetical protein